VLRCNDDKHLVIIVKLPIVGGSKIEMKSLPINLCCLCLLFQTVAQICYHVNFDGKQAGVLGLRTLIWKSSFVPLGCCADGRTTRCWP
jgi:hypothetical protein